MPIHDWTRVDAEIFHDFHHSWISTTKHALNQGVLPPDYYALAEQVAGGLHLDVLTLGRDAEAEIQARKRNRIAIRHVSDDRVVALIEIVSPGNKATRHALRAFVEKTVEFLEAGIHLLVLDLFPPGPRDPQGIHAAIWSEIDDDALQRRFPHSESRPAWPRYFSGNSRTLDLVNRGTSPPNPSSDQSIHL